MTNGIISFAAPPAVPIPPVAASWGYNKRTFFDDFTSSSTIDLTNTGNAGFNWYCKEAWPNATVIPGQPAVWWQNLPVTPASDVSVAGSIVTIAAVTNSQGFGGISTAAASGAGYVGTVFSGGFYVEVNCQFNAAGAISLTDGWPILWGQTIAWLLGTAPSGPWVETDFMEDHSGDNSNPVDRGNHLWDSGGGDTFDTANDNVMGDSAYHKVGFLWVPMAQNGGTGLFRFYTDNVGVAGINANNFMTYTSGQRYSAMEGQSMMFRMGGGPAGNSKQLNVDSFAVWQLP